MRSAGRAWPAAQPQTLFTNTSLVPSCAMKLSTPEASMSSVTPIEVMSSRMGWTRTGSYGMAAPRVG